MLHINDENGELEKKLRQKYSIQFFYFDCCICLYCCTRGIQFAFVKFEFCVADKRCTTKGT